MKSVEVVLLSGILLGVVFSLLWRLKRMSQALDNLNANIAALGPKVDALLAKQGVPEADVQTAADAVKAIADKIPG